MYDRTTSYENVSEYEELWISTIQCGMERSIYLQDRDELEWMSWDLSKSIIHKAQHNRAAS